MYTLRDGKIYYKSDFNLSIGADGEVEVDHVMGERVTPLNATYLFKKLTGIVEAAEEDATTLTLEDATALASTLTSTESGTLTSYPWIGERISAGWEEGSTRAGVITTTASDTIDTSVTVSHYDSLYKEHLELENYKARYKSWFPDRELDEDKFKTLPSDIAKETMQLFCVEVVSDLIENLFKEALDNRIDEKRYAVGKLGECRATYNIVHAAIDRFKLDREVLKQLLNKTITEPKEKFRPRIDIDAAAGLFFETKIDWEHINSISLAFTFDLLDGYVLYIAQEGMKKEMEMTKTWEWEL